uniref:Uncharacterized protein n=1 Tax=Rhizophora mucronata TaxID=61149 RepID=A0A2P2QMD0_RHIMU
MMSRHGNTSWTKSIMTH